MDVLIRFSEKGGFFSYADVEDYFKTQLLKQDNYFYIGSNMKQIKKNDYFYFSYKGQIIVKAKYLGITQKREADFPFGYQVSDITIFNPIEIDNNLFKGQSSFFYINTKEKKKEIIKLEKAIDSHIKRREYISALEVNNFTLFDKMKLEFAEGINVFIGENGTGKSQILKLLYTLTTANNTFYKKNTNKETYLSELIVETIENVFKGKRIQNLISFNFNRNESDINMNFSNYNIDFSITAHTSSQVKINKFSTNGSPQKILFIPAKEILSNFKGFRNLWEEYLIPFDKTFYDLVKALDRPLLKDTSNIRKMNNALEDILNGEIIQENGEFLLKRNKDGKKIFSAMMAEGLRKIGTLSYLLKNNSLSNESILIWDEPEANLNPRTIQEIAKLLIALQKFGIQIFIATHSLFLIKEIEILKKDESNVKYFGFGFDENHNLRVSQNKEFDYLDDLIILDEEIAQSDRFMREIK
ncbi:MAG TPA: hypothetical protein EYP82_05030 [Hydrogenothermaceae bacterium]|nr:hypothetical protein [Hydrogenothermaceae bacterium]